MTQIQIADSVAMDQRKVKRIAEEAGIMPRATGRSLYFPAVKTIRACVKQKTGNSSADRRNDAQATKHELECEVLRKERPKSEWVRSRMSALGSAVSRWLDDERFPQQLRDEAIDSLAARIEEEMEKVDKTSGEAY